MKPSFISSTAWRTCSAAPRKSRAGFSAAISPHRLRARARRVLGLAGKIFRRACGVGKRRSGTCARLRRRAASDVAFAADGAADPPDGARACRGSCAGGRAAAATGAELLTAYIVGIEVACRLGDAVDPSHYLDGFHPTGHARCFGAAAACAHLLKLGPDIDTPCARHRRHPRVGAARSSRHHGQRTKRGHAAENGVLAATLGCRGVHRFGKYLRRPHGIFFRCVPQPGRPGLLRFGDPFFLAKPGVAHEALSLRGRAPSGVGPDSQFAPARHGIAARAVERIRVDSRCKSRACRWSTTLPRMRSKQNSACKFAVAVAVVDGAAGLKQFTDERVHDPKMSHLMKRVELVRRPAAKQKHADRHRHRDRD